MNTREMIAQKYKEGRANAKLSKVAVARQLGVTGQAIWNYEKGLSHPPVKQMLRLAEIYNINSEELQDLYFKHGQEVLKQKIYGKGK